MRAVVVTIFSHQVNVTDGLRTYGFAVAIDNTLQINVHQ